MADPLDAEISALHARLVVVFEETGGKAEQKQEHLAPDGSVDRFMELKGGMMTRLAAVKTGMEEVRDAEAAGNNNPKEVVQKQQAIREHLRNLNEEWRELESIYQSEARKKRSKYTAEEMQTRLQVVQHLQQEIQSVKDLQRQKYMPDYKRTGLADMADAELFKGKGSGPAVTTERNMEMTDQDRTQLQVIKDRDAQIDVQIDEIGRGVDDLKDLAQRQNEEVRRQNAMLQGLEQQIDDVHEKVVNVNASLKEKLDALGGADKFCVNLMCIVVLMGLVAVLFRLTQS